MSTKRLSSVLGVSAASLVVAGLTFLSQASAHIGASHAPFSTTRPDLVSAAITTNGQVRACFDEIITTIVDPTEFELLGYDSSIRDEAGANDATIDPADQRCVLIDYTSNPSLSQFTIFKAEGDEGGDGGAVADSTGNENTSGAVGLQGSALTPRIGNTDAPEGLTVVVQPGPNRITYNFDEPIDPDTVVAAAFGFQEGNGTIHRGDAVFDAGGSSVTIQFDAPADDVEGAVRFFVDTAPTPCATAGPGVYDRGILAAAGPNDLAKFNTLSAGPSLTPSGPTADPDLISVTVVGNNTLEFTFDENVVVADPACFIAHSEDGDIYNGDVATSPSATTVRVTFNDVNQAFQEIVRAGVVPGAVTDTTAGTPDPNSYGMVDIHTAPLQAGYSDGPDLEQALTDRANDTVKYCHDEALNLDTAQVDPAEYAVYDNAGNPSYGIGVVEIADNCITIAFSGGDVDLAVAAGQVEDTCGTPDRLFGPDVVNPHSQDPNTCGDRGNEAPDAATVAVNGPAPGGTLGPSPSPGVSPSPGASPSPGVSPSPGPHLDPGPGPQPGPQPNGIRVGLDLACSKSRPTAGLSERVIGSPRKDRLCGFQGNDLLAGKASNDVLIGGAGSDTLRGGPGRDVLKGSGGQDACRGGETNRSC